MLERLTMATGGGATPTVGGRLMATDARSSRLGQRCGPALRRKGGGAPASKEYSRYGEPMLVVDDKDVAEVARPPRKTGTGAAPGE